MNDLFRLEHFSRDSFRVKRAYIDAADDLVAGILLGQIVYWNLPNENGHSRLKVVKEGERWLAKGRTDWWDEIRITPKQFDRAAKILKDKGFIEISHFKFDGAPTIHIKLNILEVTERVNSILPKGEIPFYPLGENDFTERDKSLTEITTEITTEIKDTPKRKNRVYEETSTEYRVANFFVEMIRRNNLDFKQPNMQKWADTIRLMMEKDNRTEAQIRTLIEYVQTDDFEIPNVLSPDKLRKRFDQLRIKWQQQYKKQQQAQGNSKKIARAQPQQNGYTPVQDDGWRNPAEELEED